MVCLCLLWVLLHRALCSAYAVVEIMMPISAAQHSELKRHRICAGPVDLSKRLLFDLWDKDTVTNDDFMGFVEVSLQELILHAQSQSPIPVQAPAGKKTLGAGQLYVEKASLGFPLVRYFLVNCISILLELVMTFSTPFYTFFFFKAVFILLTGCVRCKSIQF
jgi:hypothetical protein